MEAYPDSPNAPGIAAEVLPGQVQPVVLCRICGKPSDDGQAECDRCWYGMRMAPDEWQSELAAEGIEVERGIGCQPIPGGFICGNPYRRKGTKAENAQADRPAKAVERVES